ncbi:YtzH-like family protein [Bacillus sp. CRN 9]|uniref:YtzH-like family protein n=1 Tax=Cytobacillus horneckiae TaxID=549687 RepID=UPI001562E262|nr:hypothetical protein [Bacillus sp. CRN 9]
MPISQKDQLSLLQDILTNHSSDACGSVSECEQLERLVQSLMLQNDLQEDMLPILEEVHKYSQDGIQAKNLNTHIEASKQNLSQWVDDMIQLL